MRAHDYTAMKKHLCSFVFAICIGRTNNFLQYAFFKGRRCSDDFPWFSKTSVTKEDQDGYIELIFNVDPDDFSINSCGGGHVPIQ